MFNYLYKFIKLITPYTFKRALLRIVLGNLSSEIIKKWTSETLIPLHQKITRLENEISKLKKTKKN